MDCLSAASKTGGATTEYAEEVLHSIDPVIKMSLFEVRKATPCEIEQLTLKKTIKELGWDIKEVSSSILHLDIKKSLTRSHDIPWVARLDKEVKDAQLDPEELYEIVAEKLLSPLWSLLKERDYFLDIEGNIHTIKLTWLSAPFVGTHIKSGAVTRSFEECIASFNSTEDSSKDTALALHADMNNAIYSSSDKETFLITTGLKTCLSLILSEPEHHSALLIHFRPSSVRKTNIELAIKLFTDLNEQTKKIEARIVGGFTGQLGDSEGFHKTFLPTLTCRGINIVETFIGNPDSRPENIIFDPQENKLYRLKLSKEDDKKLNEHNFNSSKYQYKTSAFTLYTDGNSNNLQHLHLTKKSR